MKRRGEIAIWMLLALWVTACPPKGARESAPNVKPLNLFPYQYGALSMIHSPADEAVVHFALQFKGGLENYPEHLQGIEKLAIRTVAESAPEGKSRQEFLTDLNGIGASIGSQLHEDYSLLTMTVPVEEWRAGLRLMMKWVVTPAMAIAEFEQAKETALLEADRNQKDPAYTLRQQSMQAAFPGKAYAKDLAGTTASLKSLSHDRVKEYYRDFLLHQCRLTFLWSGRPERFDVEEILVGTLGKLPEGNCQPLVYFQVFPMASTINPIGGTLPQYQLQATFPAPESFSPEAAAMQLAFQMLEWRLNDTLTQLEAYPIAMGVGTVPLKLGLSTFYFHTSQPNKCAQATFAVLKKAIREGFSAEELNEARRGQVSQFWLSNESGEERLALGAKVAVALKPEIALKYPLYLSTATPEQVQQVLAKYCTALNWTISGPATGIADEYFVQLPR